MKPSAGPCLPFVSGGPSRDEPNAAQVIDIIDSLPGSYDHYFWLYREGEENGQCLTWGDHHHRVGTGEPPDARREKSLLRRGLARCVPVSSHSVLD